MNAVVQCFEARHSSEELRQFLRYSTSLRGGSSTQKGIRNEKLAQLIQTTLALKQEYSTNCTPNSPSVELFTLCNEQLKLLNRLSEGEAAWITDPLHLSATQLLHVATQLDAAVASQRLNKKKKVKGDLEDEKFLETGVRTVHTSFKLCLNDRNPNLRENKKWGVYLFTNLELKVYKKLQNRDMVRNLIKVLDSRAQELPTPEQALRARKAQLVVFYYYMAEYYGCQDGDFTRGFEFARKAWLSSRAHGGPQEEAIMLLLVPFAMLARKWYPDLSVLAAHYPRTALLYGPVVRSVRNGDLQGFDSWLAEHETTVLRQNLYVATALLRELVLLKLLKLSFRYGGGRTIVPLKLIAAALHRSRNHQSLKTASEDQLDETECVLANLIGKGYIKGYLSHGNRALVVSKTNAFPRQASSEN